MRTIRLLRKAVFRVRSNSRVSPLAASEAKKGNEATPAAWATTPTGTIMIRRA